MSKRLKQLTYCLKKAESGVVLIVFICVLYEVHAYTVTVFNRLFYMNQVPEQNISWSVTVQNKHLSSQCNTNAQIEPVQDKIYYISLILKQKKRAKD